ncbi:hypothetical protein TRFO_03513 [Tritrichomonas foetus]|uniref:Uncharacterized protein n=1 Tax=Tritrichomonas foetus TaxID=1144522 RepID=A0A1J4KP60_9EUKA|nr:hypothetical protein TRFO_03513 [Tritrichomonas foetus]|eukprot:OHT13079.1 hypothetical protein TRFO_03513 [Tritrichomonas foetus]
MDDETDHFEPDNYNHSENAAAIEVFLEKESHLKNAKAKTIQDENDDDQFEDEEDEEIEDDKEEELDDLPLTRQNHSSLPNFGCERSNQIFTTAFSSQLGSINPFICRTSPETSSTQKMGDNKNVSLTSNEEIERKSENNF